CGLQHGAARLVGGTPIPRPGFRRAVLQAASWRGFRIGPCQNADRALREALERGPFRTVGDARAACLSAADRAALEADVAAYQRDYAETLARCERAMES
ncbi:hypothetical protein, partial [Eggerthella sinensis]|uniref:hypothetical protein n=1 Tax=Eggerthella sinensis TaxID=242230 RepID=UPI00137B175B